MWATRSLQELSLSKNSISQLDLGQHCVQLWSSLVRLDLSCNKLQEIPQDIGHLESLMSFNVSHNPAITTIPDEFGPQNRQNRAILGDSRV